MVRYICARKAIKSTLERCGVSVDYIYESHTYGLVVDVSMDGDCFAINIDFPILCSGDCGAIIDEALRKLKAMDWIYYNGDRYEKIPDKKQV